MCDELICNKPAHARLWHMRKCISSYQSRTCKTLANAEMDQVLTIPLMQMFSICGNMLELANPHMLDDCICGDVSNVNNPAHANMLHMRKHVRVVKPTHAR
jgi:hypothetical protein